MSYYLQPISVDYSQQLLAEQRYHLGIILFVMCILLIVLMLSFLFSLSAFIFSGKLMKYFKNKYILLAIETNKKFIDIELVLTGFSIVYFMFQLTTGIYFIATHPIIINS